MKSFTALTFAHIVTSGASFSVSPRPSFTVRPLAMVSKAEYLQPHFEVSTLLTTTTLDMDRVKECADSNGLCGLEEISAMLQDLERLNEECAQPRQSINAECDLKMRAERETLMDELGFHIEHELGFHIEQESLQANQQAPRKDSQQAPEKDSHTESLSKLIQRFHEIAEFEEH
jgi:hypothetical protein